MLRSLNYSISGNESAADRSSSSGIQNGMLHTSVPGNGPQDDVSFESDAMRARMTIALEGHLHEQPAEMSSLFQPKLSFESTSPKPCIVPGNALQLIDDDPSASRSHTPSSIIIIDDDSHGHVEGSADSSNDHEPGRRPIPRVRFRSRVRITSGLRRSRHDQSAVSASSSASGSPSSSISAPLRWQADEHGTWGPLGRRLNAYANSTGRGKRSSTAARVKQVKDGQQPQDSVKTNERTPLLRPGRRVAYVDPELDGGGDADDEGVTQTEAELDSEEEEERALREAALKREEDAVFGQWPWRIFNRHWWWWHAEPVLCCFGEDSEYEE